MVNEYGNGTMGKILRPTWKLTTEGGRKKKLFTKVASGGDSAIARVLEGRALFE